MTSVHDWELWLHDVATDVDGIDEPATPGSELRAIDDPWGALDVAVTPLSADQRVFLLDTASLLDELRPGPVASTRLPSVLAPDAFDALAEIDESIEPDEAD